MGDLIFKDDGRYFTLQPAKNKIFESFYSFMHFLEEKVFEHSIALINKGNTKEIKLSKAKFFVLLQKDNLFVKDYIDSEFNVTNDVVHIIPSPPKNKITLPILPATKSEPYLDELYELHEVEPANIWVYKDEQFHFTHLKQIKDSILFSINRKLLWSEFAATIALAKHCGLKVSFSNVTLEQCQTVCGTQVLATMDEILNASESEQKYLFGTEVYLLDTIINPFEMMDIKVLAKKLNFQIGMMHI